MSVKFLTRIFDNLHLITKDEVSFRMIWSDLVMRYHFIEGIKDTGLTVEQIWEIKENIDAPKVICSMRWHLLRLI